MFIMDNGETEKSTDLEDILLQTKIFIKETLSKVIDLERENTLGLMEVFMMVNGKEIR
jgi:hypothetical protein